METKNKTKKTVAKKATAKTAIPKSKKSANVTFEQIKERAYQIYMEKGGKGSEIDNWLQAEKELGKS